jgi:hypothetical protein
MLERVNGSVPLWFLNAMKSFWDHLASVGGVKVFNAKGGGNIFSLKLSREFMLKVSDLLCKFLFPLDSAGLTQFLFKVED